MQSDRDRASAERDQIAVERDQLRNSVGELQEVQKQLSSTREQIQSLEQARAHLTDSVAQARSQLTSLLEQPTSDERVSQTGATASTRAGPAQVDAAQEALTKLGFGTLKADGVMGPSTRRAIEAFERAKGLAVTGELGAPTAQALERASGVSIL